MISGSKGVVVTRQQAWADSSVEETVYDGRWRAEPGWFAFRAESPTICMATSELGGRCEFRAEVDLPGEGGYFGPGALAFAAAGARVVIYAAELRRARVCCFAVRRSKAGYLPHEQMVAINSIESRYMFRDGRIRTCASLMDRDGGRPGAETYTSSLATALFAAVADLTNNRDASLQDRLLIGTHWREICDYVRAQSGRPIAIEELATIVGVPPDRFGRIFRQATGMSLKQWQVDDRIRLAQRLLLDDPKENLAKVAATCGFTDQSHFSRAFLKTIGLTPTAWLHIWK
jgi:AraC family transcriptional regulator